MRPVRMELKGFTSFRDGQVVNFEGLDLFAISGATGSGKSSILDAMTYALFGYVERVGKQVGRLVSQGQKRMAVKLEFRTGEARHRVTRSTPAAGGGTKILLERFEGGDWKQAGDGSDRVTDVNQMIKEIVGLDYGAFTRSVLLPQGKFAEFMVGDAKERRAILTELLGLELFERLRRTAGEFQRSARDQADARRELLEKEYGGVAPESVAEAAKEAEEARARETELTAVEKKVSEVGSAGERAEAAIRQMGDLLKETRETGKAILTVAESVSKLAGPIEKAERLAAERASVAAEAVKVAQRAAASREKAEGWWGKLTDLVVLKGKAQSLGEKGHDLLEAESGLDERKATLPGLQAAVATAKRKAAAAESKKEKAEAGVETARAALERVRHTDLVAAVTSGLKAGDACPVCGEKIKALPAGRRAPDIAKAEAGVAASEKERAEADSAAREMDKVYELAARDLESAKEDLERREAEATRRKREFAKRRADLEERLEVPSGEDLLELLDERIERVQELQDAEKNATGVAAQADRERLEAERQLGEFRAAVSEDRARLEARPIDRIIAKARELVGETGLPRAPRKKLPDSPAALAEASEWIAGLLGDVLERLETAIAEREEFAKESLAGARKLAGDLAGKTSSMSELLDAVSQACRAAVAAAAMAETAAQSAEERLQRSRSLEKEIGELNERAGRFGLLAAELRGDRIIEFLQLEALRILAAAGSQHLTTLSDGRYRLEYAEDEFFVIDTWNGEEARSARTLSGGETFLASLSLALALSEEVRSLAVTEKAGLESLFLDEGFGSLDSESLEVVVGAIEQLGGDGRMVGVITHVQELAIRLPSRVEVEKSPRGSRLRVVA
ncbi:MAG: SMC family ATPase [Actinomycetota bacterium]